MHSPDAADQLIDKLKETFDLMATQPLMGRARPELAPALRSFTHGRYVIFYLPIEDGVNLVRILDGRQDLDAIFEE